jgi:hypothetical protein
MTIHQVSHFLWTNHILVHELREVIGLMRLMPLMGIS